jgi:hypothetical protein
MIRYVKIYFARVRIHRVRGLREYYWNLKGAYRVWKYGDPL